MKEEFRAYLKAYELKVADSTYTRVVHYVKAFENK